MAALTRGLRRVLVIVFLAFAAVGSYYAWTGPEGASSAERAPLMVVEAPEVREPRREVSPQTFTKREEASPAGAAASTLAPSPKVIAPVAPAAPVDTESAPVVEIAVVDPVFEDVIEILPPRAAAEFESDDVEPEPVDASSSDSSSGDAARDPASEIGVRRHRIESGETLSSIAARYYGDASEWRRVAAANPGLDADRLAIGMVILVPTGEVPTVAPESPAAGRTHVVAEGETLSSIASAVYGDSSQWRRLYEANRSAIGADPGAIRVGMRLVVPAR